MLRTQIQITEAQSEDIRRIANRLHISIAEVVRRGIEFFLRSQQPVDDRRTRAERVLALAGRFRSDTGDGSENHDAHLVEAYRV